MRKLTFNFFIFGIISFLLFAVTITFIILISLTAKSFLIKKYTFPLVQKYELCDRVAVIIEPRKHPAFSLVISNIMRNLDRMSDETGKPKWELQIFHGTKNQNFVKQIVDELGYSKRCTYDCLDVEDLNPLMYACVKLDKNFYRACRGKKILMFETDSILCDNSTHNIEEFLDYDYIGGALIDGVEEAYHFMWGKDKFMMNGGISIRDRQALIDLLTEYHQKSYSKIPCGLPLFLRFLYQRDSVGKITCFAEDMFFNHYAKKRPNKETSLKFAICGSNHGEIYKNALALHKPWKRYWCKGWVKSLGINEHISQCTFEELGFHHFEDLQKLAPDFNMLFLLYGF